MFRRKKLSIYLFFILIFSNIISYSQPKRTIENQIQALFALKDDSDKVDSLNSFLWKINSYDSTNTFLVAQKSIALSKKLNYLKGLATAQKNLAAYYYYKADYPKALKLYQKSLKNFDSCQYKKGIAIDYRNIGNVYAQLGTTKEALKNFFKSLELREEIHDTLGIAKTYSAIGNLYTNTEAYKDSAIVYFNRALKIFEKTNSIFNITSTYINISNFYYNKYYNKPKDSLSYLKILQYTNASLKLSKKYNLLRFEGIAYEILGETYRIKSNNDSTYYYLSKSLQVRKKDNNVFGIINSYTELGSYFLSLKNYTKAEQYLKKALELSLNTGTKQITLEIYSNFSNLYQQIGNYKKAFYFYNKYSKLKDTLQSKQNTKQLTQMAMQYEFDKKQKIQELEQKRKDEMTQAEIKRQKIITYFLIIGLLFMLLFAFVIFRSYKQKQKTNQLLREKNDQINIKNAQLNQRNEEIEAQRDEIEAQRDKIISQRDYLERQNKEITASINYAQRIQQAVLTPISFFENNFKEFFILFKPRDIVSGDYYWGTKLGDKIIVTAADCTGHGVPGAFMSLLGVSFLNQIVNELFDNNKQNFNAANILNKLRETIVLSLGHGAKENINQEGMDMAIVIIDYNKNKLEYAGAYNPLLIIKNNELQVVAGDRMPVGYHFRKMDIPFTNHIIEFEKDTNIFMFSDGYQDQFGGIDGKKFTIKKLKQTLLKNNTFPMSKQKEILSDICKEWIEGQNEEKKFGQIDDILIMGIKL